MIAVGMCARKVNDHTQTRDVVEVPRGCQKTPHKIKKTRDSALVTRGRGVPHSTLHVAFEPAPRQTPEAGLTLSTHNTLEISSQL